MAFTKINAAGIGTTETVTVDGLTVINDGSFGGNLTVGGVLTYEDVTNVDSVGLITARNGIVVGSGITLSKDGDGFFTGVTTATTFVGALTGNVTGNVTGNISGGTVAGSTGTFTGDVDIADKIVHTGDTDTAIRFSAADTIQLETGGAARFTLSGGNIVQQSGTLYIKNATGDSNGLKLSQESGDESRIFNHYSGALTFGTANTERVRIDSSGRLLIGSTAKAGDSALQVYSSDKLHPAIRVHSTNANGFTMFGDAYQTDESNMSIGISYSSASLVISQGCKVSTSSDDAYVSSQDSYSTKPNVFRLDTDGSFSFLNTNTSATTTTDSAVSLTERLRITSDGRLLLGTATANSSDIFTIVDPGDAFMSIRSDAAADNTNQILDFAVGTGNRASSNLTGTIAATIHSQSGGTLKSDLKFSTNSGNNLTEKLRIDSDGRLIVGGGTHTGGSALVVKGGNQNTYSTIGMFGNQSNPASGVLAQLRMGANTTAVGADIRAVADAQWGSSDYPTRLEFGTVSDGSSSRTERMRIISNGHTKITNNGTYQSSTGTFHEMRNSSTNQHIMWLTHTGVGDVQYGIRIQTANEQNDTTHNYIDCREGGSATRRFIVYANGNVQNQNNSYGSLSDEKLKENITDANSQWDDIKTLKVRNFNFINDSNKVKYLGLVAQEAETVCPSLVFTSPDTEDDSETGQIKETGTETKSLKYSVLYMKAIKCLQEAQTRIETLETKVAALEG